MRSWTYAEMKAKVLNDLDLNDEDFISSTELLGYFNEAIDDVEAVIHGLYQDYFLTTANIALVIGTQDYTPPTDIYANLIRTMTYSNGNLIYEIEKIKRIKDIPFIQTTENYYKYIPINTASGGYKFRLYPTPTETSSSNVSLWYIRNAKQLTLTTDVCDIPEFINVILQHVKVRCYEKEPHPNVVKAMDDLEKLQALMVSTLVNMVDDEHETVDPDFSFYREFDSETN